MIKRRWLARAEADMAQSTPAPEIEWINSRTGILGESFGTAVKAIEGLIKDGTMIVVREEEVT